MAQAAARSSSGKWPRNGADKQDEVENNGYIQILVKPLEEGNYSVILGWLGLSDVKLTHQQVLMGYTLGMVIAAVLLYQMLLSDLGFVFHRLTGHVVPIFSMGCAFYWLALYFRKSWSTTSVYVLFCACFAGEILGQFLCDSSGDAYITRPVLALIVLLAVSGASVFSSLETVHSTVVILMVSLSRYLACTTLTDLPQALRPLTSYFCGVAGVIAAKYMETVFRPPAANFMTQDGKIPVIKRRRSSASSSQNMPRVGRRTSLPALIHSRSQSMTSSYESAIISEAHGLVADMLAESNLPPHIISGLRAVSNLLKPNDNHGASQKPKVSPLVSLTENNLYRSEEDLPYTGERPSSLPKRLRRSLPPSLIRRMSTSTWTTTTSATGMPTLEPEPCRTRSSSFRHSRENTPGSSPANSRSNSPSPSSPTNVSLIIPKSRSFSLAAISPAPMGIKRGRDRRSVGPILEPKLLSPNKADNKVVSPSVRQEQPDASPSNTSPVKEGALAIIPPQVGDKPLPAGFKRTNVTSDYESSESAANSDHSDLMSGEDTPHRRLQLIPHIDEKLEEKNGSEDDDASPLRDETASSSVAESSSSNQCWDSGGGLPGGGGGGHGSLASVPEATDVPEIVNDGLALPFQLEDLEHNEILSLTSLNKWEYPIFELASEAPEAVLSSVAYKLFSEVGLFDTFRIPVTEFLHYFHTLELGYREKPYHNRVHATDVLHGVYFLTTQPIPGFVQVNPEGDTFHKQASSSESDSEAGERCYHHTSFTAEDTYGIMGGNFPPLELMALYAAAAMHDFDHPGRTNAFLVATYSPLAVTYNDRSVLECHHAAAAWRLFLSSPRFNWLCHLDKAEFKRFRFLVIEAILATDLKRHFEILAEFNAKANEDESPGIDWTQEQDRLMAANMVIKLADINGPAKPKDLHVSWTNRITEEFYEQGDEEARLGLQISPYMDRKHPQLAKLQESFINHLVAPLLNSMATAGLLPGTWVEDEEDNDGTLSESDKGDSSTCKDTEDEDTEPELGSPSKKSKQVRKIHCTLTKNLKDNYDMWIVVLNKEQAALELEMASSEETPQENTTPRLSIGEKEMEPIKEEDTPPNSANSVKCDPGNRLPSPSQTVSNKSISGGNTPEGTTDKTPVDNETNKKSKKLSQPLTTDEQGTAACSAEVKKELKESAV